MTDIEIMDALAIPAERRWEWVTWMHVWARQYLVGPATYAAFGAVVWRMMQQPAWKLPEDAFDASKWTTGTTWTTT